eukprot:m.1107732 g.1107732  ORF g.1107732 m.1107732 type:complete len:515 (+) comp24350_c0_seq20:171-1715(+)
MAVPNNLVFGYGSLINRESRRRTIKTQSDFCVQAEIQGEFGYCRCWRFRSDTGFTALAVCEIETCGQMDWQPQPINGVLHATGISLSDLDKRERGYKRVAIPPEYVRVVGSTSTDSSDTDVPLVARAIQDGSCTVYIYVPVGDNADLPCEDFPICQTYLDTVLEGCLEVGGRAMAEDFVRTTLGWSQYFLYDTPTSRRPWLHRPNYEVIDEILFQYAAITKVSDRKHPEEFAAEYLTSLRGLWGVPARNPRFCGRESEIAELDAAFVQGDQRRTGTGGTGIQRLHVIGLGGVGKTQLVTEYAYRSYSARYGLIVWVDAESEESIAGCMRRLASDVGLATQDKPDSEIIEEVKARLYRARCSWLVVYDNVESASIVDRHLPRGAHFGHVLVTSRRIYPGWEQRSMTLGCFPPLEAIDFLTRAAGESATVGAPLTISRGSSKSNLLRVKHVSPAGYLAAAHSRLSMHCIQCHRRRSATWGLILSILPLHIRGNRVQYQIYNTWMGCTVSYRAAKYT